MTDQAPVSPDSKPSEKIDSDSPAVTAAHGLAGPMQASEAPKPATRSRRARTARDSGRLSTLTSTGSTPATSAARKRPAIGESPVGGR